MQHKLVDEDQHRMYEDWVLDKADLALTKRNVTMGNKRARCNRKSCCACYQKIGFEGKKKKERHPYAFSTTEKRPHTVTGATGLKEKGENGI